MNEFSIMNSIALTTVLNEMDIPVDGNGNVVVFSIRFIKKNGEMVYYPKARKSGVNMNMKKNAMRGVVQTDAKGKPFGHPVPVKIWYITEFNGKTVKY